MNLLLDTSIFLWYITKDKKLSTKYTKAIQNSNNNVYLSVVSIWECIIKQQIGKLNLPDKPAEYLINQRERHEIAPLPLSESSLKYLAGLPIFHKDPFDRILICQSKGNDFTFVTSDSIMKKYDLKILYK